MNHARILKCQSCGSSSVQVLNDSLAECEHCGTQFVLKNAKTDNKSTQDKKNNIYVIIFSMVLLVFMVVWRSIDHQPQSVTHESQSESMTTVKVKTADLKEDTVLVESVVNNKKHMDSTEQITEKPQVNIISEVKGETITGGIYWIFAIRNDSSIKVNRANVVASLFNSSGKRVDEQAGWSKREILAPNEESVVLLYIADPPKEPYTVKLAAQGKPVGTFSVSEELLEVSDFMVKKPGEKRYEIIGDVVNTNDYQMDFVKVIAVALNKNKQPIGVADAFVSSTNIAAQQQSGFKITAGTFLTEVPDSWSLWAKGRKHKP